MLKKEKSKRRQNRLGNLKLGGDQLPTPRADRLRLQVKMDNPYGEVILINREQAKISTRDKLFAQAL